MTMTACTQQPLLVFFFFFNDTATTEIYTLSLHDALPISIGSSEGKPCEADGRGRACHPLCVQQTRKNAADAEGIGRGCGFAQRVEPRAAARTLARGCVEIASCNGRRPRVRRQDATPAVTAGPLAGARRVHSRDGPHTRMTRLHLCGAWHLSHGRGNTRKRLPGADNASHLAKPLRLCSHEAAKTSWRLK